MRTTDNVKKIDEITFHFFDSSDYFDPNAIKYWFNEDNFTRLITYLFGNREFYIGEIFNFYEFNTLEIKDENGRNLFDRNLSDDFDDVFSIHRKQFVVRFSNNNIINGIFYELAFAEP